MTRGIRALPPVPRAFVYLVMVAALAASSAVAQVCRPELDDALVGSGDPTVVTGLDAARALERAVSLVEPALPASIRVDRLPVDADHPDAPTVRYLTERRLLPAAWVPDRLPVDADHPDAPTVRYLTERRLLPAAWVPDRLEPSVWHEMLRRFLRWYALDPPPMRASAPADDAALADELARILESVADAIRPAALFATDPDDRTRTEFRAVIWNWSVYPRLLVFRPAEDASSVAGTEDALASLETCVRRIRHWFSAPAPTARQLFLEHLRARMVVVGAEGSEADSSTGGPWPWWVPAGDELPVFEFTHPRVAELQAYSVVFDGPALGVSGVARLLPSVRTNVSPIQLRAYLQTPR